jgi:hypothetical protein
MVPIPDLPHWGAAIQGGAQCPGALRWYGSRINNGILEGRNSLVQADKTKARGAGTFKNLKSVAVPNSPNSPQFSTASLPSAVPFFRTK